MDTQDTQNCWEPIIHEKEGVINAFVKEALDSLEERLTRTAEGASDEYMVKLEEEEYAKAVKILTDTYAECPHVKHIQDTLDKPDFIWDSLFIENIGPDAVNKWYRNPLKADIQTFKKDNTIYDTEHPYFSYIYKVVLYERYIKFLLEDKKKHQLLIKIVEEERRFKEREQKQKKAEADAFIADMEQRLAERKVQTKKGKETTKGTTGKTPSVTPSDTTSTLPTFEHVLTETQLEHLTSIINELHIFCEKDITTEQIKSIFACSPTVILKSKNNRLLAHLFDQLSRREYITENWQAVIAKNMLFKSSQKDDFLNQNDLSTATNKLQDVDMVGKYSKLEQYIKNLKNH